MILVFHILEATFAILRLLILLHLFEIIVAARPHERFHHVLIFLKIKSFVQDIFFHLFWGLRNDLSVFA